MSVTTPAWMRGVTAPNPGPMTLQGTNTWILGIDGLVVVDPGPLDESHLLDVAMHGAIDHILLTHGHGDHIAANGELKAPIYIHKLDAGFLADPKKNLSAFFFFSIKSTNFLVI